MKSIRILLISLFSITAYADTTTPEELAKNYVASVQAKDSAAIQKLLHPKLLDKPSAQDKKLIDLFVKMSLDAADRLKDPMRISSEVLSPERLTEMGAQMTWKVPPEVQIQIETYRILTPNSSQGTGGSVQWAAKHKGQFYFILACPKDYHP